MKDPSARYRDGSARFNWLNVQEGYCILRGVAHAIAWREIQILIRFRVWQCWSRNTSWYIRIRHLQFASETQKQRLRNVDRQSH